MERDNTQYNSESLLKASDVAKRLNISRSFAYLLMKQGKLRTVRINGARRVRPVDLERFICSSLSVDNSKKEFPLGFRKEFS
jgi:excisionase family DNA binding protein